MGRPFVAIVGGFWNLKPDAVVEAKEIGKALGVELAKAGFGLVVHSSEDMSLEPYVVSGYASAIDSGKGLIRARYAQSQTVRFTEQGIKDKRDLFDPKLFPSQDWEAPFYRSLAEEEGVDAVLLLAGATTTLIAGQIAMARKLPILAINQIGGAAETIWGQLFQTLGDLPSSETRTPAELVDDLKRTCEKLAAQREDRRRREEMLASLDSQNQKATFFAASFAFLLITMFFGLVYTPTLSAYPFIVFTALIASGATGALARNVLAGPVDNDSKSSCLLGGLAGFVVGVAYLIPQWVGAPGVLEPKALALTSVDKIQFISAVVVAVSAGVGFDTVLKRLQTQAQDLKIRP